MNLDKYRVVLASQSPRRRELLGRITEDFEVCPSAADEDEKEQDPAKLVELLSRKKAAEVFERLMRDRKDERPLLVIGSDTVVALAGEILGKPGTEEKAAEMLRSLSGRAHDVFSGVTLLTETEEGIREAVFSERTEVIFSEMTEEEIAEYVESGDPMDKAGAYGIQGKCGIHIEGIRGDYYNVMGFPVSRIYRELKKLLK